MDMDTVKSPHKRFSFGRYRGRLIAEVAREDPGYVVWVYNNIDGIVSKELYEEARIDHEDRRYPYSWGDLEF